MNLRDFVKQFVRPNTFVRLWVVSLNSSGYQMLYEKTPEESVCMEWKLLQEKCWHSRYLNCTVLGVKDIFVDDFYREAVNIVIKL